MKKYTLLALVLLCVSSILPLACHDSKRTHSATFEGPDKKHVISIDTTDKEKN